MNWAVVSTELSFFRTQRWKSEFYIRGISASLPTLRVSLLLGAIRYCLLLLLFVGVEVYCGVFACLFACLLACFLHDFTVAGVLPYLVFLLLCGMVVCSTFYLLFTVLYALWRTCS